MSIFSMSVYGDRHFVNLSFFFPLRLNPQGGMLDSFSGIPSAEGC